MAREWARPMTAVAACLPAAFWLAYATWNIVWPEPPRLGPVTAINVLYLAMLPAAVFVLVRRLTWPGRLPYAAFLAFVGASLVWAPPDRGVAVAKILLVYALLGLAAAQVLVGSRRAAEVFAASLIVVGVGLSLWTIGHAVSSGFRYRGGVPVNPNLPATLIAPAVIAGIAMSLQRGAAARAALTMGAGFVCLYACLLLGSRGVLVALIPALAIVVWRERPTPVRGIALVAGVAGIIGLAQTPAVPHAVVVQSIALARDVQAAVAPVPSPVPADADGTGAAQAAAVPDPATPSATAPPAALTTPRATDSTTAADTRRDPLPDPPPLVADAATSTALSRFQEEGVGTFNLRRELWLACFTFSVSGVAPLLVGGGMGTCDAIAHATAPVFQDGHQAWLQLLADFGLVGLGLFVWMLWSTARALRRSTDWLTSTGLGILAFWAVAGLTSTVTDLHVFWISIGVAAATAQVLRRAPAINGLPPQSSPPHLDEHD